MARRRKWRRDSGKEQLWRRRLRDWQRSGLTGRDFCARHALSEPSFYAWRREIGKRDRERATAKCRAAESAAPAFMPVHVVSSVAIEVVLRGGQTVRVAAGFEPAHLRAVVVALEEPSC